MDLNGKLVLVVGAGVSGVDTCHYLLRRGARILLTDKLPKAELSQEALALEDQGVTLLVGNVLPAQVTWDLVVTSPGVPPGLPIFHMSRAAGIPIFGEIEMAWMESHAPFVCITGTNGKTTTTSLTAHILRQGGKNILLGGNIGQPLIDLVSDFHGDAIVAEISSYQLETCQNFHAHVGAFLNLTPDHLDRHGSFEAYGACKAKLFANQTAQDTAILNQDDDYTRALAERIASRVLGFSLRQPVTDGAYLNQQGRIVFTEAGQSRYEFPAERIFIKGRHNIANSMAASLAALAAGADYAAVAAGLESFRGVPHRLEFVCEKNGVLYINDSKGTNPDSTYQAVMAYDQHMILLLGGRNKGIDMHPLLKIIQGRDIQPILFGEALPELKKDGAELGLPCLLADDFQDAVRRAQALAKPGDVVMLSPACTSWDAFPNFEVRGDLFKQLVQED